MKRILLFFLVCLGVCLWAAEGWASALQWHGFAESAYGPKLSDDQTKRDNYNLFEQRLQLKTTYFFDKGYLYRKGGILNFKADFIVDEYYSGKTGFDLREANLSLSPWSSVDIKIGRQVLTWGTGDYLFVNDLFPKDYVSFFIGRDDEYLKKPSDALKVSFYSRWANMDLVMTPRFTPNTTAKGDRLSFFDAFQGDIAGLSSDRHLIEPPFQLANSEYAFRAFRNVGRNEVALYVFSGFDKNPASYKDEATRQLYYERLKVYGASLRGPFLDGIANVEAGYYHSRDDGSGTDRLIANSQFKFLAGYTKDLGQEWGIGAQYFYEQKLDYGNYTDNFLPADIVFDEYRHVFTQRLTKLFRNQTVAVSVFNFYSPSDRDGYARPSVAWDFSDDIKIAVGANLPWGEDDTTEFGQMKRNKNIYARVRYSF